MINLLSIRCSLAFAPYLAECASEFLKVGHLASRVVRQAGSALIIRSDGYVMLRHQNREATLTRDEAEHYFATVEFRSEVYDVLRMEDEVVLANVGNELLLSHPQSELWLDGKAIAALVNAFYSESSVKADDIRTNLPEWLSISTGGGRLLLSDQRTARWVLLSDEHIREFERRLRILRDGAVAGRRIQPPTIPLKGLVVHLQSAFKLATLLEGFANDGSFAPFEEVTPTYSVVASRCTEGVELRDSDNRVALTPREARKWAGIIRAELNRLNVSHIDRAGIRTVFAGNEDGRWILQWGDEVFLPGGGFPQTISPSNKSGIDTMGLPIVKHTGDFTLLLMPETGACVAVTKAEARHLQEHSQEAGCMIPPDAELS
jgi:hypothetical protein